MNKPALATSILAGLGTMSLITIGSIIAFLFWPLAIAGIVGYVVYYQLSSTSPSSTDSTDYH